jgi:hypothetical protein
MAMLAIASECCCGVIIVAAVSAVSLVAKFVLIFLSPTGIRRQTEKIQKKNKRAGFLRPALLL